MSKELARSARALGRDMNFFGSKEKDFVIQTKGRVKINFGDKFIELFNGSKFTTDSGSLINTIDGEPKPESEDGFYFDKNTGTLYLKIGDKIIPILNGGELVGNFISFKDEQNLTSKERDIAKENIGSLYLNKEDALANNAGNGLVFIQSENKAYILNNGVFYPITNNTTINQDQIEKNEEDKDNNYFDKTVTIDVKEGPSLVIKGVGNEFNIQLGDEYNNTNIYQSDDGGVIESDNSFSFVINDNKVITINEGSVDFDCIINALKGIITDEIYSSNFEKDNQGWGIWIDKETGESYLQVDHIISGGEELLYITYQEACELIRDSEVKPNKIYLVVDYQNEWEITKTDDVFGEDLYLGFNPFSEEEPSNDPSLYDEDADEWEPIFGVDRNVRPILLTGISQNKFSEIASYYYNIDRLDLVQMLYDIRVKEIPDEDNEDRNSITLDFEDKGRIYYARDSWNNEAPCDFKHFTNADGKYVFTSPDGKDLSSMNTVDSIVCSNNKILDVTIRISDSINPMIITGKRINSNTVGGSFENVSIGDKDSIIEYNYFNGEIKNCNFTGTFTNNSIGCLMDSCEFKKDVINNEFNKDIKKCTFNEEVKDNVFDMSMEECIFGKIYSNQLTGSMKKCETYNKENPAEFRENQMMGDFSECKWLGNVYSNDMKVDTVNKCIFKKDMFGNQIASSLWEENTFEDTLKFNVFQADVVKFLVEGLLTNNQFIGRINDVSFFKDLSNKDYGINNNIINGTFDTCKIYVDFSHNTITGPIYLLTANVGETYIESTCQFNYNDIKAASIHTITTNGDFRRNNIKAQYFGLCTFNNVFECNNLSYYNMRSATYNKMVGCSGSGDTFIGTFSSEFINCEFGNISNCTFRESPIKFAKFRNNFSGQNFDSNTNIQDLEKLYNDKHQVDVFFHNNKIVVSCQACNEPLKGEIKMFNGLASDIPEGWHICDGTEGTPDLTDKFIKASTTAGQTGGAEGGEVTLESGNIPSHEHSITFDPSGLSTKKFMTADKYMEFVVDEGGDNHYCMWTGEREGDNEPGYEYIGIRDTFTTAFNSAKVGASSSGGGSTTPINIEPPYYTLIFIMKL